MGWKICQLKQKAVRLLNYSSKVDYNIVLTFIWNVTDPADVKRLFLMRSAIGVPVLYVVPPKSGIDKRTIGLTNDISVVVTFTQLESSAYVCPNSSHRLLI